MVYSQHMHNGMVYSQQCTEYKRCVVCLQLPSMYKMCQLMTSHIRLWNGQVNTHTCMLEGRASLSMSANWCFDATIPTECTSSRFWDACKAYRVSEEDTCTPAT